MIWCAKGFSWICLEDGDGSHTTVGQYLTYLKTYISSQVKVSRMVIIGNDVDEKKKTSEVAKYILSAH